MTIARAIAWLLGGGWKYVAGAGGVIALLVLGYALYSAGYESAEQKCEAAALKARVEKLETELKTANDLAASAQVTARLLRSQRAVSEVRQQQLREEVDLLRRQSTDKGKQNAKRDALVDARCDFTARGVQFFTRPGVGNDKRAAGAGVPAGNRSRAAKKK